MTVALPPSLMIFAAGFGTRMGRLTADRPKPLIEVAGRALIDHALELADAAQVGTVVINLHYRAGQIRQHLKERSDIRFSEEQGRILETGGGLRHALPLLGEGPVLTLNSDAVWTGPNPLVTLRQSWEPSRMDALLMLVPRERATGHTGRGDFRRGPDGRLRRAEGLVYSGAQIISTGRLHSLPDPVFSLNRIWDQMAAEERLFGVVHSGGWCDVGHPEAIPLAEALLKGEVGV